MSIKYHVFNGNLSREGTKRFLVRTRVVSPAPKEHVHEAETADLRNEVGVIGFIGVVIAGNHVDKRLTLGD